MTSPMHPLPLETPSATLAAGRHGRERDEADQANRDPEGHFPSRFTASSVAAISAMRDR